MAYAVGIALALLIALFATVTRFDRDRAFYPTLLIVFASYYILFAIIGGSTHALLLESIQLTVFAIIAVVGFRFNLWWVVIGGPCCIRCRSWLSGVKPGGPPWWPGFCLTIDASLAAILAWLLYRGVHPAHSGSPSR